MPGQHCYPANHANIVKPCNDRSDSYIALKNKLRNVTLDSVDTTPEHIHILSAPEGFAIDGGVVNQPTVNVYHGLDARESISIEPFASRDSNEAFQQQFSIMNNGPLAISNVQFACAITSITPREGIPLSTSELLLKDAIMFMVPIMKPMLALGSREKTNIDCDYLYREGLNVARATIEIEVAFKLTPDGDQLHVRQAFSGRRDSVDHFQWTYGSPIPSPLEGVPSEVPQRTVMVVPFGGGNRSLAPNPSPNELMSELRVWVKILKIAGCRVMVSTMMSSSDTPN